MSKSSKTETAQVSEHIEKLPTEIQAAVQHLRAFVLSINSDIAEHIKWNSPAFYYGGEMKAFDPKEYKRDLIVMNLRKGVIMLVMPTGAKLGARPDLNEENYKDGRRILKFKDFADIQTSEDEMRSLIEEWLCMIEK